METTMNISEILEEAFGCILLLLEFAAYVISNAPLFRNKEEILDVLQTLAQDILIAKSVLLTLSSDELDTEELLPGIFIDNNTPEA